MKRAVDWRLDSLSSGGKRVRFIHDAGLWFFFILALFYSRPVQVIIYMAAVCLHECAHIASAWGFGFKVREMRLLPTGGVAVFEGRLEAEPFVQAIVALTGPLHNFIMAGLLWAAQQESLIAGEGWRILIRANLALGVLNLLPVIPLDGGKVLHMFLAMRIGWQEGKKYAFWIGRMVLGMAAAFIFIGFLYGFWNFTGLGWIFYLWWALEQERLAQFYQLLRIVTFKKEQLRRQGVLPVYSLAVSGDERLINICRRLPPKRYHLLVMLDGRAEAVRGMITEMEAVNMLCVRGTGLTMAEAVILRKKENTIHNRFYRAGE
ncbi:MAG: site-2 protease family protein [Bacillota bacterium]